MRLPHIVREVMKKLHSLVLGPTPSHRFGKTKRRRLIQGIEIEQRMAKRSTAVQSAPYAHAPVHGPGPEAACSRSVSVCLEPALNGAVGGE